MNETTKEKIRSWLPLATALFAFVVFYVTTNGTQQHFDYTARIAFALLHGHAGLQSAPPSWLNEMIPRDGRYYSAFPLGAVLSMMPVAILQTVGVVRNFPGHFIAALIAAFSAYFFWQLSRLGAKSPPRQTLLALFPIFATWTWCNVGFGGAWQLALGLSLLGEAGALYFILVRRAPLVAGCFFALAFGNRTELILTGPIFLYLLSLPTLVSESGDPAKWLDRLRQSLPSFSRFLIAPAALALLTAAYNYARFGSVFDFGYAHIPNVLQEPWYQHGLFSVHAIPWNIYKMLFEGFGDLPVFPYIHPYAFGCSIFLASPFLFLLFREGGVYKSAAWAAIGILTFVLWCHGNPGGWQFSYRYAVVLLPWMFLLILGNGPAQLSVIEVLLFVVSVAINAVATYQFLWTDQIHP